MRALITGGAGLIGSHIADRLVAEGVHEIVVLDNLTRGRRQNLDRAIASGRVTIVEGESLVNDGTALVLYRVAVAAVLTGSFSLWEAGLRFVFSAAGGIAIGIAVGFVVAAVRRRLDHPPTEITISLMTGYFAYLPAEVVGVTHAVLTGISTGAVFMGANTYIGNGPNFMVKSIAEEAGVKMPGFLRYIVFYTLPILLPLFLLIGWLFFRTPA